MRLAICAVALLCLGSGLVFADPADVEVGTQRATFNKNGTQLREKAGLSKLVKMLPYGTRVRVDEVSGRWLRVTEFEGTTAGAEGWLKASQTVEPFALTQGGQFSRTGAAGGGDGTVSRRDAAAASRQFSKTTEAAHKQVSTAAIQSAYRMLDASIEMIKPTLEEVEQFITEGRLGRPADAPQPDTDGG